MAEPQLTELETIIPFTTPNWEAQAACLNTDTEAFYQERPRGRHAKSEDQQKNSGQQQIIEQYCGSCAVRSDCLATALKLDDSYGIQGGLADEDRKRLHVVYKKTGTIPMPDWLAAGGVVQKPMAVKTKADELQNTSQKNDNFRRPAHSTDTVTVTVRHITPKAALIPLAPEPAAVEPLEIPRQPIITTESSDLTKVANNLEPVESDATIQGHIAGKRTLLRVIREQRIPASEQVAALQSEIEQLKIRLSQLKK